MAAWAAGSTWSRPTRIIAREGSELRDRGFWPGRLAAAGTRLPAGRRSGAGAADRRAAGLRSAGLDDAAAGHGPVRVPAVPGGRAAAVRRGDPHDPGADRGDVRRPPARTRRVAGPRSRPDPRGGALVAEDRHAPRPGRAADRRPAGRSRPEPPARRRAPR